MAELRSASFWVLCPKQSLHCYKRDFFQFYRHIKATLAKMQTAQNLTALCELVVQEMHELTGFDRVMIYRFNEGGDGSVIAESKLEHSEYLDYKLYLKTIQGQFIERLTNVTISTFVEEIIKVVTTK
ncbi:MAG: hypothetical protein ACK5WL_06940 [Pseudanabaena sp.]